MQPGVILQRGLMTMLGCVMGLSECMAQSTGGVAKSKTNYEDRIVYAVSNSNTYGAELILPDGSVIKSVWPAALGVADVARPWRTEPFTPRCEPAVYSFARVLPDGKELWAKSYLVRTEIIEVCDPDKWGSAVRSGFHEYGGVLGKDELIFLKPYDGTFFVGRIAKDFVLNLKPPAHGLHIDAETGDVVGPVSREIRVLDAHKLREIKLKLWAEIERQYPPLSDEDRKKFKNLKAYSAELNWRERLRFREQYRRLESLIFKTPNPAQSPNRK